MIHQWKFRGKDYSLDTGGVLRIIQKGLADRANLSKAERFSIARLLDPIILRVVAIEKEYVEKVVKPITEQKDLQDLSNLVLYEILVPPEKLQDAVQKLRITEPMKLSELFADEKYDNVMASTQGFVEAIFESDDQVRVRAYLQLSRPA